MPGLVGTVSSHGAGVVPDGLLESMIAAMPLNPVWLRRQWRSSAGACEMTCFARDNESATSIARSAAVTIAFDGELFGIAGTSTQQAATLLDRFVQAGSQGLQELEGQFVAAVWNDDAKRLTLITDKFASKPFYYSQSDRGIAFGTSINALKGAVGNASATNLDGLVQFFTFGHLWNDDTFYDSIKAASPACWIEYDALTGQLSQGQYWRPEATTRLSKAESLQRMTSTLADSVRQQSRNSEGREMQELGVALSGGLDARTMLALVDTDTVRPACVSLGMEGSLDQRSARRLAELAGCPFHSLILGEGFLENFRQHLQQMVQLTDGHYLDQCIVMPTFPLYESLGIRKLLRGHAGELLHMHKAYNFSIDDDFAAIDSDQALTGWLWQHLQSYLTAGVPEPLLQNIDSATFAESGRRSLDKSLQATAHFDHPMDRISQLFLDQRTRRETAMSMSMFSSVVDPRLPYLNSRFISAVFATDPSLRVDEDIQAHMLRTCRPDFMHPANSNTGAPVGVSALRRKMSYYRMRVLAKLGVKGYQPYERLGLWLRRELRPLVESILLDAQCLDRGLFNPECVRNVVRRHMEGKANHTYLLMAMMILELEGRS